MGDSNRREFLAAAGATAALATLPAAAQGPGRRPNILFILADDLGFADLGCYGRRDYATPAIDALAAGGVLMRQGYSNSAVCSPTRVGLITGRYQHRLEAGLPEPITPMNMGALPAGHPTLPSLLKAIGYQTSLVGKWHIGWPPEHGSLRFGYDRFFGVAAGAVVYFSKREHGQAERYGLFEGDAPARQEGYLTDLLAERAMREISTMARAGRPFLLSLHFTAPHWPWQGPGDAGSSAQISNLRHDDGGSLAKFGEMMRSLDGAVGRVLAALTASGTAEDTIVVFTSDNGGERFSDTWPLRGGKGQLLEGGIRVPLVARWPGRIPAGARSDQVMVSMDWLPTLCRAAGAACDPAFPPDGADLLDVLRGAAPARPRKLFWRFRGGGGQAAVRDGDWKYLRIGEAEGLFHIPDDPRERANLREKERPRFEQLRADYAAWARQMLAYPPPGPPPPPGVSSMQVG
jgi:arylsulfatase A-like enzyme